MKIHEIVIPLLYDPATKVILDSWNVTIYDSIVVVIYFEILRLSRRKK